MASARVQVHVTDGLSAFLPECRKPAWSVGLSLILLLLLLELLLLLLLRVVGRGWQAPSSGVPLVGCEPGGGTRLSCLVLLAQPELPMVCGFSRFQSDLA
jgi:hypothetical protein